MTDATNKPLALGLDRAVERLSLVADGEDAWQTYTDAGFTRPADTFRGDLRAILALSAPADGYVLVPVEPTEAMRYDGDRKLVNATVNGGSITDTVLAIYRAMIAAALPAAPTGETGG